MKLRVLLFLSLFLLAGCVSGGKKWWSPGTWFSSSEAHSADKAVATLAVKQAAAIKAAHVEVAKTSEALVHAPESREVELARQFNDTADALLTQGSGAIPLKEIQELKKLVADLRSENAQVRAAAEARQAASDKSIAAISGDLASAERKLGEAQSDLRTAFDRENALADQLRNERMVRWTLAGLSLVLAAGWLYVRYVAGGLPSALVRTLRDADKEDPSAAKIIRRYLDRNLDRNEQDSIAKRVNP